MLYPRYLDKSIGALLTVRRPNGHPGCYSPLVAEDHT